MALRACGDAVVQRLAVCWIAILFDQNFQRWKLRLRCLEGWKQLVGCALDGRVLRVPKGCTDQRHCVGWQLFRFGKLDELAVHGLAPSKSNRRIHFDYLGNIRVFNQRTQRLMNVLAIAEGEHFRNG